MVYSWMWWGDLYISVIMERVMPTEVASSVEVTPSGFVDGWRLDQCGPRIS